MPKTHPAPSEFLGSLEARVMEDVWKAGESAVGDVLERLNKQTRKQLAYNTVMSVMSRLAEKGYLEREKAGRAFLYSPAVSRDEFALHEAKRQVAELVDIFGPDTVREATERVVAGRR